MSEARDLLNTLRVRLKEIFDLERRLRELLNRLRNAEFPAAIHSILSHSGFPGGGTTFLRDDGTFASAGAGTPSATVEPLDGTGDAGVSTDYSRGDHKHADANRPTDDEKDALDGTGTPSAANKFVTADTLAAVDGTIPDPSATVAALDGTSSAGASAEYSRGDHKHSDANRPTDNEKAALAGTGTPSAGNKYVTADTLADAIAGVGSSGSPGTGLSGTIYPIKFTLDGAGTDISLGVKKYTALIPPTNYDGNIVAWNTYSPVAGDITIDVLKNGVSITNSNYPELSGSSESDDFDLSDWDDVTVFGEDRFSVEVITDSGIEFAELQLIVERT